MEEVMDVDGADRKTPWLLAVVKLLVLSHEINGQVLQVRKFEFVDSVLRYQ